MLDIYCNHRSGHTVLTACVIIHSQPHVDRAFPHLWAIFNNKVILLSALDGQKLQRGKKQCSVQQHYQKQDRQDTPHIYVCLQNDTTNIRRIKMFKVPNPWQRVFALSKVQLLILSSSPWTKWQHLPWNGTQVRASAGQSAEEHGTQSCHLTCFVTF